MWENEENIMESYPIEEKLNQNKIIIIHFESLKFKVVGLYIEKYKRKIFL